MSKKHKSKKAKQKQVVVPVQAPKNIVQLCLEWLRISK
jgi:hypothetical protein